MLTLPGDLDHRIPFAPLLRQLELRGGPFVALTVAGFAFGTKARGRLDQAITRAIRERSLTVAAADQLCCEVLGLHPFLVYGDSWWVGPLNPHWHEGVAS